MKQFCEHQVYEPSDGRWYCPHNGDECMSPELHGLPCIKGYALAPQGDDGDPCAGAFSMPTRAERLADFRASLQRRREA